MTTAASSPVERSRIQRVLGAVPAGFWFVADQGVVSLANFAIPVLVGRYGGQQQLGFYTLGLSIYIVANALARSLVWTAYTKDIHKRDSEGKKTFTGSATIHLAIYAAVVAALMLVAMGIAAAMGQASLAVLFCTLAPTLVFMLTREHVRRLSMARLDYTGILLFDISVAVLQVGLMLALAYSGRMTATGAFGLVAASAALSLGWLTANRQLLKFDWKEVRNDWRANWKTSKWLSSAAASATIGNQGYRWVLPALTSLAELGRLGAAQAIVQVTNPIVIGLSNYLGPLTAKINSEKGLIPLWRFTVRVTLQLIAAGVVFVTLVGFFGVRAASWLLQDAAEGVSVLLLITLAMAMVSEALLMPIQAASVNRGRAQLIYKSALLRLAVNLTLGFGLVGAFGAEGIGVGVALGGLLALVWQWIVFAKEVRHA